MFKWDKCLFEQLVGWDAGQSPNIMSVPPPPPEIGTVGNSGLGVIIIIILKEHELGKALAHTCSWYPAELTHKMKSWH